MKHTLAALLVAALYALHQDVWLWHDAEPLVFGLLPVVPMTIMSAVLLVVVSKLTALARPAERTLARYFR